MPSDRLVRLVLVNSTIVFFKIREDGESGLDGSAGHDGVLDCGDIVGVELNLSLEGVLVGLEIVVGGNGVGIARLGSTRGALGGATILALGGVGVISNVTVVVAVGHRVGAAQVSPPEGVILVVSEVFQILGTSDDADLLEILPRGV